MPIYTQPIFCSNCLTMSTRPRISFDKKGLCNACVWSKEKSNINWNKRKQELKKILDQYRKKNGEYDCLVPVSGGKDGSYVAYNLKKKYGMNPLCITIRPHLPTSLGNQNIYEFVKSDYTLITIDPSYETLRKFNKIGFIEMGFPYYGWLNAIFTAVIRTAVQFGINLIFYAEDGEVEYGGTTITKNKPMFDIEYIKKIYVEGGYEKILNKLKVNYKDKFFLTFPSNKDLKEKNIKITHWSYFENWDPYRNYLIAKDKCGLKESVSSNTGTFTNFSQNDQLLYNLHTYLMYLKFGFGRANQDSCIEIRRGAISRSQAKNLVLLYDGKLDKKDISYYLDYYKMNKNKFYDVLNKWTNKKLFKISKNGEVIRQFEIK